VVLVGEGEVQALAQKLLDGNAYTHNNVKSTMSNF